MHRGTEGGGGLTTLGDDNFLMTGSHVAHDCHVGNRNIFANCATLAGHVEVGDGCTIGAFSAVHQFCRVGDHAFMGGFTVATQDVLPFMKTAGARDTKSYGVNSIGLQRKGFSADVVEGLKRAHRLLFHAGLLRDEAMTQTEKEVGHIPEVAYLLTFIREAKRGVHRG
jgi:UDP-N-acetylglucosamine acyltransferase